MNGTSFFKKLAEKNSEGKHLETQLSNQNVSQQVTSLSWFSDASLFA